MLKAVIFDMDGVLIDSEPLHAEAAVKALKSLGTNISLEYCYGFIGSTTIHMLNTIIQDYHLNITNSKLEAIYRDTKSQLLKEEGYTPIPFTKELIINLLNHGIKLAIASSSTINEIEDVVKSLEIEQYFHVIVSGTMVKNPKPAPDVFLKAMEELGVNRDECIIIEDSHNGVRAAKSANIPVIGFINKHSGKQDLSKANMLIEGFEEINYNFINKFHMRAINKPITIAVTDRLIIREMSEDDFPNLYKIYQNDDVKRWIGNLDSFDIELEKHKAYISNVYPFYDYGFWGIYLKDSGEIIGKCGIQNIIINNRDEIEIGYLLDTKHRGNGFAVESVHAVLKYAKYELNLERIVARIEKSNIKSIKVAEHVGFKKEQEFYNEGYLYYIYQINL